MAFPYKHRHHAGYADLMELHKLGDDDGTPVPMATAAATDGHVTNIDLTYNEWAIGIMAWATAPSDGVTVKVYPYVDHQQTIVGNALSISAYGATDAATVITLAATSATSGFVGRVLSGGGILATIGGNVVISHGLRLVVATTGTTGTYDVEMVCVPKG